MDKWDQEKFAAIMEAGCDEVSDIDDIIEKATPTAAEALVPIFPTK